MNNERICKISTQFLPELKPKCFSEACIDQGLPLTLWLLYLLFTSIYILTAAEKSARHLTSNGTLNGADRVLYLQNPPSRTNKKSCCKTS